MGGGPESPVIEKVWSGGWAVCDRGIYYVDFRGELGGQTTNVVVFFDFATSEDGGHRKNRTPPAPVPNSHYLAGWALASLVGAWPTSFGPLHDGEFRWTMKRSTRSSRGVTELESCKERPSKYHFNGRDVRLTDVYGELVRILSNPAQISIEPGDHLSHQVGPLLRHIVGGVESHHLFVGCGLPSSRNSGSLPRKTQSYLPPIISVGAFSLGAKSAWSVPGNIFSLKNPPSRKTTVLNLSSTAVRITPKAAPMLTPM